MTTVTLQELLLPGLGFAAPEDIYARVDGRVQLFLHDRRMEFADRGHARFDTFFNGISIGIWRQNCVIETLGLELEGSGRFLVKFGLHRMGHAHRWLDEVVVELAAGAPQMKPLEFWPQLDGGMLYVSMQALGRAALTGGRFVTFDPALNEVKLGVVITHFNRKPQVLAAIGRITGQLLTNPRYRDAIGLVVVDNSRNIEPAAMSGATILPNRNLGGSGGFMRGLLHLQDHGYSHCLFMDDDASCEMESITRTWMLLRYARPGRRAIAGSLLREIEPYRLFEKGARFDGFCRPLKSGLDMRRVDDLIVAEHMDQAPDYGGWWFFAFRITEITHYAYPFFVRGDDILFCLMNHFEIVTMNGIGGWGDDFSLKSAALSTYLDVRSHIMQNICTRDAGMLPNARMIARFFMLAALSYNYGTARAVTLAMTDVGTGPDFWLQDMDMRAKRAQIAAFSATEKMAPIDRAKYDVKYPGPHETRRRRWARRLSLNGFLLPGFLLHDDVAFQHKSFSGTLRCIYRFKKILYEYEPLATGYVAMHDKAEFFSALAAFLLGLMRFCFGFRRMRAEYRRRLPALTSEAFWRQVYAAEIADKADEKVQLKEVLLF